MAKQGLTRLSPGIYRNEQGKTVNAQGRGFASPAPRVNRRAVIAPGNRPDLKQALANAGANAVQYLGGNPNANISGGPDTMSQEEMNRMKQGMVNYGQASQSLQPQGQQLAATPENFRANQAAGRYQGTMFQRGGNLGMNAGPEGERGFMPSLARGGMGQFAREQLRRRG